MIKMLIKQSMTRTLIQVVRAAIRAVREAEGPAKTRRTMYAAPRLNAPSLK